MSWTTPADLCAQVLKLWDRGEILASLVTGESPFPKRLVLKGPTSAEMAECFDEVRAWIAELRATTHCRIEMREFRHRVFGANVVPQEAWVDTVEIALALIGKQRDAKRFSALVEMTAHHQPPLLSWLAKRPLRALELVDAWSRLLDIVAWLQGHPRPGVYLRQVDIPGVHSKFIEANRGVLMELLDGVLPPEFIDSTASGINQFAARYGFLDKPERIRFRALDPEHALLQGPTSTLMQRASPCSITRFRGFLSPRTRSTSSLFHRPKTACSSPAAAMGSRCCTTCSGSRVAVFTIGATLTPTVSPSSTNCAASLSTSNPS